MFKEIYDITNEIEERGGLIMFLYNMQLLDMGPDGWRAGGGSYVDLSLKN